MSKSDLGAVTGNRSKPIFRISSYMCARALGFIRKIGSDWLPVTLLIGHAQFGGAA